MRDEGNGIDGVIASADRGCAESLLGVDRAEGPARQPTTPERTERDDEIPVPAARWIADASDNLNAGHVGADVLARTKEQLARVKDDALDLLGLGATR